MRKLKDYAGRKFGRLTGLDRVGATKCEFLCECGSRVALAIKDVVSGHTSSCGCIRRDILLQRNQTHGLSRHRGTYRTWKDMRARCSNPNDSDYRNYGARGIVVCPRWNDFAAFFADMGERPSGLTLDRIDTNGNYEPANCRWATPQTQANNKRSNHTVVLNGGAKTLQQHADKVGIDPSRVRYRLNVGYTVNEAFKLEDLRGRT